MTKLVHVQRFWTDFKQDPRAPNGMRAVDKVAYGPVGSLDRSLVITEVSRLSALLPLEDAQNNPAIEMAHQRWNAIRPYYDAWKAGQEMPIEGTALAAWNAVTSEQAEVLKSRGIRTVEDVAAITDAHIGGVPVPRLSELRRQAKLFLENTEVSKAAAVMAQKDEQIQALQSHATEQADQIKLLMERVEQLAQMAANNLDAEEGEGGEKIRRKPGPKPKQAQAA